MQNMTEIKGHIMFSEVKELHVNTFGTFNYTKIHILITIIILEHQRTEINGGTCPSTRFRRVGFKGFKGKKNDIFKSINIILILNANNDYLICLDVTRVALS